ncbi:MAG: hypothetical protein A2156_00745 [Deltaproteobacteria bacterium RBG_16_48_10]|nr:MAG: hypothetical protein A2156_00745 [Deltaproteobacteria bacterium RBG_16_48_10]
MIKNPPSSPFLKGRCEKIPLRTAGRSGVLEKLHSGTFHALLTRKQIHNRIAHLCRLIVHKVQNDRFVKFWKRHLIGLSL